MRVLAIDTATAQTGVAIGGPGGVLASAHHVGDRRHVETLAPFIERVCREAGAGIDTVDVIAVDIGPGTFTGLRVGLAAAKALAHVRQIPMVGASSLELLAYAAKDSRRRVVSIIDALRDEVFYAAYRLESGRMTPVTQPQIATPLAVATELRATGEDCLIVGDGARRYASAFEGLPRVEMCGDALLYPSAAMLVEMAVERAQRGELVPPTAIELLYLRPAYTETKIKRSTP
jgi:tRNA threonylcarbamoyladenosine biosynthesis protein TsaB